jgi:hypothetical protein
MSAAELSFGRTRKFFEGPSRGALSAATLARPGPKSCEGVRTAIPKAEQPRSSAIRRFDNFMDPRDTCNTTYETRTLTLLRVAI